MQKHVFWYHVYLIFEFKDQRFNEVEKIDQRDNFMISNKPISIPHIEFVIPHEFKSIVSKIFLFLMLTEKWLKN